MTNPIGSTFNAEQRARLRQRYLEVDTSNVADVLDELGFLNQGLHADFRPFPATAPRLAGWAYTIRGQMSPYGMGGDPAKMQACEGLSPDDVSVWSGDGEGICYFGELIAVGMKERGCVGALVDGGIRDVRWIGASQFPVYARYRTPVQSIGRWRVTAAQTDVYLRGCTTRHVRVSPGDFILADDDGAIVIPSQAVEQVLVKAESLMATEKQIRAQLQRGLTLDAALATFGHV